MSGKHHLGLQNGLGKKIWYFDRIELHLLLLLLFVPLLMLLNLLLVLLLFLLLLSLLFSSGPIGVTTRGPMMKQRRREKPAATMCYFVRQGEDI